MSDLNIPSTIETSKGYKFGFRDEIKVRETSPGPIYHLDEQKQEKRKEKKENSNGLGFGKRD